MNTLLNRCQRRTHLAEELTEEVWLREHRGAMLASDVEEVIRECIEVKDLILHACKKTFDRLFDEDFDDTDWSFRILHSMIEKSISNDKKTYELAMRIAKGYTVEGLSSLPEAIGELERLSLEVENRWPKIDQKMVAEALAAYKRGEFDTSEDLLRVAQNSDSKTD